jgi:IS30 family transposase
MNTQKSTEKISKDKRKGCFIKARLNNHHSNKSIFYNKNLQAKISILLIYIYIYCKKNHFEVE